MDRRVHLVTGIVLLLGFLASGLHLQELLPGHETNEGLRMAYRANHIYLLMGALMNIALGLYLQPLSGAARWFQFVGSTLLVFAPWLLAAAFVSEPGLPLDDRVLTYFGVIGVAVGLGLHLLAVMLASGERR